MGDEASPEGFFAYFHSRAGPVRHLSPNERSTRGQTACMHCIRATVTVYSRLVVFSDRNERISKLGDRIVLSTQLK